jgi:hypothetical protein
MTFRRCKVRCTVAGYWIRPGPNDSTMIRTNRSSSLFGRPEIVRLHGNKLVAIVTDHRFVLRRVADFWSVHGRTDDTIGEHCSACGRPQSGSPPGSVEHGLAP